MSASVRVMVSFDYCQFEVAKGTDEDLSDRQINELRKDCQRLVDEAVRQYRVAKARAAKDLQYDKEQFLQRIENIKLKKPESRTIEEMAMLRHYENKEWEKQFEPYDYDDDDERYL